MKARSWGRTTAVIVGVSLLAWPSPARAVERCKAKIRGRDGTILVNARKITGQLKWGGTAAGCAKSFDNEVDCLASSPGDPPSRTARKCRVGPEGTTLARTPPADCTIDLCDDDALTCEAYIKGCTPGVRNVAFGWVDATEYGVKCDGASDDTDAILAAIDALLSTGGEVHLPSGNCIVTGLEIVDKKVTLVGHGGSCNPLSANLLDCGTVLRSTTDAPIVKFTMKVRPDAGPGRNWVGLRDLAIQGSGEGDFSRLNNQHCLQVDNRGFIAYNVTLAQCGGHGLYLTDSVFSTFYNLRVSLANGDGIHNDDTSTSPVGSANGTTFFGGAVAENGRDGIRIVRNGWGTQSYGTFFEQNAGYGINLVGGPTSAELVRFGRFLSVWDELNGLGSVRFGANAMDNIVDFVRYASGPPVYECSSGPNFGQNCTSNTDCAGETCSINFGRNLVSGSNLSGSGPGADQAPYYTFRKILTTSLNSSTFDELNIRNSTDTADGDVRLGRLTASSDLLSITPGLGLVVRSPNGSTCRRIGIENDGTLRLDDVTCPSEP